MANHKSAKKRIRSSERKRLRNRYQLKTARTFIKKFRATTDKEEARKLFGMVCSMLDKLAKKRVIHPNNAANKKSKLHKHLNNLLKDTAAA
ncbi:MAG: 30S ribosomal protein S20 [Flammeovirgaceae bacterium]|nr:30S ribosomal protein S20 [Flammeovirgaceae bacterium]